MKFRLSLLCITFLSFSFFANAQYRKIVTIAGSSSTGAYGGDGGRADSAQLHGPNCLALDASGNIYIEDYYNFRVRKVSTTGYITTYVGNGTSGYSGDGGLAYSAQINPNGMAIDRHGNLYISDYGYNVIRKVNSYTNIISLFAGQPSLPGGYAGDSGLAIYATFNSPKGMCFDKKGNLYIADVNNHVIRRIDSSTNKIWNFAGNHIEAYGGDGGFAINASLDSPMAVAADNIGNIYIADYLNNVIRKVDTAGIITTFAGNTTMGYSGDGGPANNASLRHPRGVTVDTNNFVYIADAANHVIRMVDTNNIITTIAGNGTAGYGGDNGPAVGANLYFPQSIVIDTFLHLYIADADNQRVRKVYFPTTGIKNVSSAYNINVYPNPCTDFVNIAGLKTNDKVAVYNIIGTQIGNFTEIKNEAVQTINIEKISTGTYFLHVYDSNNNFKAVIRIIKE